MKISVYIRVLHLTSELEHNVRKGKIIMFDYGDCITHGRFSTCGGTKIRNFPDKKCAPTQSTPNLINYRLLAETINQIKIHAKCLSVFTDEGALLF
jgi:hypothetical protein